MDATGRRLLVGMRLGSALVRVGSLGSVAADAATVAGARR